MKNTLLLTDESETTRLMLKGVAFDELLVRDTEAHAAAIAIDGGIPVRGVSTTTSYLKRRLQFHHQSNSEITRWNT